MAVNQFQNKIFQFPYLVWCIPPNKNYPITVSRVLTENDGYESHNVNLPLMLSDICIFFVIFRPVTQLTGDLLRECRNHNVIAYKFLLVRVMNEIKH